MEIVKLNKQERLRAKDSSQIKATRNLARSFGKSNDYIEIHIHDLGGKWLNSIPNYKNSAVVGIYIFFIFCMMNSMIHGSNKYFLHKS